MYSINSNGNSLYVMCLNFSYTPTTYVGVSDSYTTLQLHEDCSGELLWIWYGTTFIRKEATKTTRCSRSILGSYTWAASHGGCLYQVEFII